MVIWKMVVKWKKGHGLSMDITNFRWTPCHPYDLLFHCLVVDLHTPLKNMKPKVLWVLSHFIPKFEVKHGSTLSGWWYTKTPLKNDGKLVSWDDDIPNIWKRMF